MTLAASIAAAALVAGCPPKAGKDYAEDGKRDLAREHLKKIAAGAQSYYANEHVARGSMRALTGVLPASVGPSPAKGACCNEHRVSNCEPEASVWDHPSWRAVEFSVDRAYDYSYELKRVGTRGEPGYGFDAIAYGDLDCDGEYSTFTPSYRFNPSAGEGLTSAGAIVEIDPKE